VSGPSPRVTPGSGRGWRRREADQRLLSGRPGLFVSIRELTSSDVDRKLARRALRGIVVAYLAVAVFERFAPRRFVRGYQKYVGNPLQRNAAGLVPGFAVIETIGRRTGQLRRVPVGGALRGTTFWFVAGDARHAGYVRNIEADPRVRVKVHGRWRAGTAQLCPDDNPRMRLLRLNPLNSLFVWIAGTDLLTVRVDLERS
jgi:deazaflavin-dependent oxidoreductase (nitroreductase family)